MSKAVLISIKPEWCALIVDGNKTIEVRKSKPNLPTPFKCYIYCTYGKGLIEHKDAILPNHLLDQKVRKDATWGNCVNGKVVGEFVCNDCSLLTKAHYGYIEQQGCVSKQFLKEYMGIGEGRELAHTDGCYGWHISDLVIYDKPKELGEFIPVCGYRQDGECTGVSTVDCPFQRCDYNPDGSINIVDCAERVSRAPQSWCYVEGLTELPEGGVNDAVP